MRCPHCGKPVPSQGVTCQYCMGPLKPPKQKDRVAPPTMPSTHEPRKMEKDGSQKTTGGAQAGRKMALISVALVVVSMGAGMLVYLAPQGGRRSRGKVTAPTYPRAVDRKATPAAVEDDPRQPANRKPTTGQETGRPTITMDKETYKAGEAILIRYSGLPGNTHDWISMVKAGASPKSYGQWFYTKGKRAGTHRFKPLQPGRYEVRVYFNWPKGGYTIRRRHRFVVLSR